MKMRIFFREGIFVSFVFAPVFFSAYSEDLRVDHGDLCTGALESVGKIVCDDDALCYEADGAFTCVCKDNPNGDGWAGGSGCSEGLNQDMPESGREKRYIYTGNWFGHRGAEPCKGNYAYVGRLICVRNSICMQGFRTGMWLQCICQSGKGNGVSSRYRGGTGCR